MHTRPAPPDTTEQALRPLALAAIGRTGADIERIVRESRRKARRQKRALTWADLLDALASSAPPATWDKRRRIAVHEAGHAVVWVALGIGKIETLMIEHGFGSALRGEPVQGHTQSQAWLAELIASYLAGRAAELLVFGEAVAGSGGDPESDLARATKLALDAETTLGFADHQPLLYRPVTDASAALAFDAALAARVDRRLRAGEAIARSILEANRDRLLALARSLDQRGVLEGAEVTELIGTPVIPEHGT